MKTYICRTCGVITLDLDSRRCGGDGYPPAPLYHSIVVPLNMTIERVRQLQAMIARAVGAMR